MVISADVGPVLSSMGSIVLRTHEGAHEVVVHSGNELSSFHCITALASSKKRRRPAVLCPVTFAGLSGYLRRPAVRSSASPLGALLSGGLGNGG